MGKKNPYITTIGFNKDDPEHVRVAEFLNEMGRGKASYIVKSILYYESVRENGEIPSTGIGMDYDSLRGFVLKVIAEHEEKRESNHLVIESVKETEKQEEEDIADQLGFDATAIEDILNSVESFRS